MNIKIKDISITLLLAATLLCSCGNKESGNIATSNNHTPFPAVSENTISALGDTLVIYDAAGKSTEVKTNPSPVQVEYVTWNVDPKDIKVDTVITEDMVTTETYSLDDYHPHAAARKSMNFFFNKEDVIGKKVLKQPEDNIVRITDIG